jgi:hypothetical protein
MMTEVMVGSFLRGADGWDKLWQWVVRTIFVRISWLLRNVALCS